MEITLQELGNAFKEFRAELEKKEKADQEKIDRLQAFFDRHEEEVNQPLLRAQMESKQLREDMEKLQERLERSGLSETEAKDRIEKLEIELATRGSGAKIDYRDTSEYKARQDFCIHGYDDLKPEQKALLRTDSGPDGGYLVTTEMDSEIIRIIQETDPIRQVARVRTIGSKAIAMPTMTAYPTATYEGEAEEGSDSQPTYGSETVTTFAQTVTIPLTRDQLMDAAFDMEAEVLEVAGVAFAYGEGYNFVLGSGHKVPQGFAADATLQAGARETAASGVLDPEAVILLTGDLKVGYNGTYGLNRKTLATLRTKRADAIAPGDGLSGWLWQPGLNGPVSNTLAGYPYILCPSLQDIAGGAYSMVFADFRRGYTIIDRTGTAIIRDEVTRKKERVIELTLYRYNTGRIVQREAIKLLKIKS